MNVNLRKKPTIAIIVPCFNEEVVLDSSIKQLSSLLEDLISKSIIGNNSFICFVDDGSSDQTWMKIYSHHKINKKIKGLRLSTNFGHQNALLAGMNFIKDKIDCSITVDADLQQDIATIPKFIEKYIHGADIVFGIRKNMIPNSLLKKTTAIIFYSLMRLLGVKIISHHSDYRLVSRPVIEALSQYGEVNLFLRGIFYKIGFNSDFVYYNVKPRLAGVTKYNLDRMVFLAIEAITSFSIIPIRIITFIGLSIFSVSMIMIAYYIYMIFFLKYIVPSWVLTVLPIYFIGSLQMMSLGVIGEYMGKIYLETKRRPRYIIRDQLI